jgi:hypothetical protein
MVMKPARYRNGSQSTSRSTVRPATAHTDSRAPRALSTRRPSSRLPTVCPAQDDGPRRETLPRPRPHPSRDVDPGRAAGGLPHLMATLPGAAAPQSPAGYPPRRHPAALRYRRLPGRLPGRMHHFVDFVWVRALGPRICRRRGRTKTAAPGRPAAAREYAGGQGFWTLLRGSFRRSQRLPSGSISTVIRLSP